MGKLEREKPLSVPDWIDKYFKARAIGIGAFEELLKTRTVLAKNKLVDAVSHELTVAEEFPVASKERS